MKRLSSADMPIYIPGIPEFPDINPGAEPEEEEGDYKPINPNVPQFFN